MRTLELKVLGLGISLLLCGGLRAAEPELSPSETIRMLEAVEAVKKRVGESRHGIHASSIQAFRNASESATAAYDFYVKCYREFNFDRRDARESEYREWKERNIKYLRSKEHSEARRLQLQFLILTLRAAQMSEEDELETLVPELTTLIDNGLSAYPHLGKSRRILHESAVASVYGKVYNLESSLHTMPPWGSGPMDIQGIYERTILPLYRSAEKAEALSSAWDKRIAQATSMVGALDNEEAEVKFADDTLPRLRWNKYMDLMLAGKRRSALTGMVALVQRYPDHDAIDGWLETLTAFLSGERDPGTFEDLKAAEAVIGDN